MSEWQEQLDTLLASLNVAYDDDSEPLAESDEGPTTKELQALSEGSDLAEQADAPSLLWLPGSELERAPDTSPLAPDGEEVSAIRSEIDATVWRVMALVQAGRLNQAMRDDVLFVLQALTRPPDGSARSGAARADDGDQGREWNLTSAAAVLRFCRIVLRLTNALDGEL